jgi:3'(2'), 5'-bisphosphate nucleotidase
LSTRQGRAAAAVLHQKAVANAPAYQRELEVARALARDAGELVLQLRRQGLAVEMKPGNEPVTAADRAASEFIVSGLRTAFADDVVISEEATDDLRRTHAPRVWYVDPIDGTRDFIRGHDGFAVMIGLAVMQTPVLGVLHHPPSRRLLWAASGQGAWVQAPDRAAQRIFCSPVERLDEVRLVASRSNRTATIDRVKDALGVSDELNVGSVGLKLGLIALGERDLYVNPWSRCKSWDTCGPAAVLQEAGGRVTDLSGAPLRYDTREPAHCGGIVASNGRIHEAAVARLAPLFPRPPLPAR